VEVLTIVRFSVFEKAVIRRRRLDDFVVLNRAPDTLHVRRRKFLGLAVPKHGYELLVRDLLDGTDRHACDTPMHAKAYERALRQGLLRLKTFIDGNADLGADTRYRL